MESAAQVNQPIFLQTPEPGKPGAPTTGTYKAPKGQITFYWGCGEKAGPGQPVVLTFDKLMRGENDPELEALQGSGSVADMPADGAPAPKRLRSILGEDENNN